MTIQLNLLRPGMQIMPRMMISPQKAAHWSYANTNPSVMGGMLPNTLLRVVEISISPPFVCLEIPGRTPPAFLKVTGEELAMNFTVSEAAEPLSTTYLRLIDRQAAVGDGLAAMRIARSELQKNMASARMWGNIAVISNAIILPLNVIVNAFPAPSAKTVYQKLVRELYNKYGKSGSHIQNRTIKTTLTELKEILTSVLVSQGVGIYVPGVKILVGVTEDTIALLESASMVQDGSAEMRLLMRQIDLKIATAERSLVNIGAEIDQALAKAQILARTA